MFLRAVRQGEGSWQLACDECGKLLDVIDSDCLQWLLMKGERPICYGCEGDPSLYYTGGLFERYWEYAWYMDGHLFTFSEKSGLVKDRAYVADCPFPPGVILELWLSANRLKGACSVKQYFKPGEKVGCDE